MIKPDSTICEGKLPNHWQPLSKTADAPWLRWPRGTYSPSHMGPPRSDPRWGQHSSLPGFLSGHTCCMVWGVLFLFLVVIKCCPTGIMDLFIIKNTTVKCTDRWLADFCTQYVPCNWKIIRWSICFLVGTPQFPSPSMVFKNSRHFLILINH